MLYYLKKVLVQVLQYKTILIFLGWSGLVGNRNNFVDSQTPISWEPLKPLLFNKDVILKCSIKDCCPEGTQWTGGKTNSLLTLGRVSKNKAKYEETWGVDASYLTIKKFGIEDGDSLYTCFHGFPKHSKNLTIKGNDFALMPTKESLTKDFTVINGHLNANVEFLEVYPEPVCNCTFKKFGVTENINVSSDFYPSLSIFLKGNLNISHQICHEECQGTIQIDCRIGIHSYIVLEAVVDIQFKWLHKAKDTGHVIICTVLIIVLTIFGVVLVFVLRWKFKECVALVNKSSPGKNPIDKTEQSKAGVRLVPEGCATLVNKSLSDKNDVRDSEATREESKYGIPLISSSKGKMNLQV